MSWSSTHVLFLDQWGTFCAGGSPKVHFRCCDRDSNRLSSNLNKEYQRLNDVGHPAPPKWSCNFGLLNVLSV